MSDTRGSSERSCQPVRAPHPRRTEGVDPPAAPDRTEDPCLLKHPVKLKRAGFERIRDRAPAAGQAVVPGEGRPATPLFATDCRPRPDLLRRNGTRTFRNRTERCRDRSAIAPKRGKRPAPAQSGCRRFRTTRHRGKETGDQRSPYSATSRAASSGIPTAARARMWVSGLRIIVVSGDPGSTR